MIEQRPSVDQLQPTGDWLLVEPLDVPEVSPGGIVMPNKNSAADAYGKVLKVGPGFWQNGVQIAPGVKAGQIIMFRKGRGLGMRFNGENVLFMNERDLLAIVG